MTIDHMLARPFSRWDIDHGVGEPSYGYFARLVALEGHSSVRVYADEIGLHGRNIVPEEMLDSLLLLPLPETTISNLRRWTPIREDALYRLGSETVKLKQFSCKKRRWCRSCLAESGHHRVWWDFVCYRVCPRHGEALVDETDHGETIRWHWPHFDIGPDGGSLTAGRGGGKPVDGMTLEVLIEGRLRGDNGLPFAEATLHDLIDACVMLGHFLSGEERPDIGFEALMLDDDELRKLLRDRIVETVSAAKLKKGLDAALGNVLPKKPDPLHSRIEWLLVSAFGWVGRIGRKRFRDAEVDRTEFTLREAAMNLHVPAKALSHFAKALGIGHTPWKDAHSFSVVDVETLRTNLQDLIPLPETIPITGVPAHEFRFLERAGMITGHLGIVVGDKGTRYLREEVSALVKRALATVDENSSAKEAVTLFTYAKRTNQPQGQVLVHVLSGKIAPSGVDADDVGFRRLRFDAPAAVAPKIGMTLGEAAKLTTLQQASISELVAMGVLERLPGSPRLDEESVARFHATYMNASLLAEQLGCGVGWVKPRLRQMGVPFAFELAQNTVITRVEGKSVV